MAAVQGLPATNGTDGWEITPSDSNDFGTGDSVTNPKGYKWAFIHNTGTGATFEVIPVDGGPGATSTAITIYIAQGDTSRIAVKRVLATGSPGSGIVGITAKV